MFSKKSRLRVRKVHRIAGLLLGVQLFFWILSGVYFSWVPLETVRGRDLSKTSVLVLPKSEYTSLDSIIAEIEDEVMEITLVPSTEYRAIYKIRTSQDWVFYSAMTGHKLSLLNTQQISRFAKSDYLENNSIKSISLLEKKPPGEYKGPLPVFVVEFSDIRGTKLYISPMSGEILARRNHYWRVFDFLWMLHILDFGEREDFNNNILRTISLLSGFIVISGYGIYFSSKLRRL